MKTARTAQNCDGDFELKDITRIRRRILSCIARTNNTYGSTTITEILRGSMNEQIEKHGLDSLSTYGIMKGNTAKYIRSVIDSLRMQEYISIDEKSIYKILTLTPKSMDILLGKGHVYMKENMTPEKAVVKEKKRISEESRQNGGLLEQLRAERLRLARELALPAYVIFTDAALYDMCRVMPKNMAEFLTVSGVGKVKAERYGEIFLGIIKKFSE